MASQTTGIPKGTRDFSPQEMVRRNYIFDTIRSIFRLYGYQPIETPAMENLSTLMGKYGEEGDKLLFKILNSGDFMSAIDNGQLTIENPDKIGTGGKLAVSSSQITGKISEKGLRYDLTVPFARYVVQHRNDITFPFKRYQIQPVWRADKPQKGRYREFYQCDVDIIGNNSLLNEVELIQIIDEVFGKLNINVTIKINNRKILSGIAEVSGQHDKLTDITTAIDKLDKIGIENVNKELLEKGIPQDRIDAIQPIINLKGNNETKISEIKKFLVNSQLGLKGIEETETLFEYLKELNVKTKVELDLVLARGLNYYTGTIFEVKANDISIGSICGGGRYDDLTGIFGLKDVSGVGISFGADRVYDVMNELNLFPQEAMASTRLLIINFGGESEKYCLKLIGKLRNQGISSELYPSSDKLNKQLKYANSKQIPFVLMAGDEEISQDQLTIKNMISGEQVKVEAKKVIDLIMC
jgi:histidyl-tRNA synthetase